MAQVLELVHANHDAATEGHKRLRTDYRSLDSRMVVIESAHQEMIRRFERIDATTDRIEKTPPQISNLRWSMRDVIFLVSVVGGMWASTSGLRSEVRDISTRMASETKIQEERAKTLSDSIEAMKRRQELQQYEIQGLKEAILKGGKR